LRHKKLIIEPSPCLTCPKADRCPEMWPCAEWVHWCRWVWPEVCDIIKKEDAK